MQSQGKFILMDLQEFEGYIKSMDISDLREINHVQTHHTWSPSYRNFNGYNHFAKMTSMEADHIARGFGQIAQHYTTFPDGSICTGRPLSIIPTCIHGHNTGGICIENLGNFDRNQDTMTDSQRQTIIRINALLCSKFGLPVDTTSLVYHHWYRQSDGFRDNGENDPRYLDHKTCPGTAFFGGNTVENATVNFLPPIQQAYDNYQNNTIAEEPTSIPNPQKGLVNAELLNVRSGPGTGFAPVDQLKRNETVTILESKSEWDRIGDDRWVFSDYIAIDS